MAKNHVQPGDTITYTNNGAADIFSGGVVAIGDSLIGIAIVDIPVGKSGTARVDDVWKLPKGTGVSFSQGDIVYWDAAAKQVVAAEGADTPKAGVVWADAADSATTVRVKINA